MRDLKLSTTELQQTGEEVRAKGTAIIIVSAIEISNARSKSSLVTSRCAVGIIVRTKTKAGKTALSSVEGTTRTPRTLTILSFCSISEITTPAEIFTLTRSGLGVPIRG